MTLTAFQDHSGIKYLKVVFSNKFASDQVLTFYGVKKKKKV